MAASEVTVPATPTRVAGWPGPGKGTAANAVIDGAGDGGDLLRRGRIVVDEAFGQADRAEGQAELNTTSPPSAITISVDPPPMSTTVSGARKCGGNAARPPGR